MRIGPIAIVGGTGALGGGLALRCARAGHEVVIGSRDASKAVAAASEVAARTGSTRVRGLGNLEAADAGEIVFVTVPFASQAGTLVTIREAAAGKIVIGSGGDRLVTACGARAGRSSSAIGCSSSQRGRGVDGWLGAPS